MTPTIVCRDWRTSDRILPRLARTLSDETGWALAETPDPKADALVAFPYLEWTPAWSADVPVISWFTHRDETVRGKAALWDRAAKAAAVRTYSAPPYRADLERYGPTVEVTPPLDRDLFRPAVERVVHDRPVVGTSGWNYRGGRKCAGMLARLQDALSERCRFTAAGSGWPCEEHLLAWRELPEWYRSLDLYVCTSLSEGVGYGPLESLASGVRTVVPRGVGVFDLLPDAPGLERYAPGDYDALLAAVLRALDTRPDPEALRATTERFTAAAWRADWLRAVSTIAPRAPMIDERPSRAAARRKTPSPSQQPQNFNPRASASVSRSPIASAARVETVVYRYWQQRAGVFIVCYGEPARACARRLVASIRRHMPGLRVALASDAPLGVEDVFVEAEDADLGARSVKTRMYELAPADWDLVAYLDADVALVGPIDGLFAPLLDGLDLTICPNPERYVLARAMRRPDNQDECAATFVLLGTDELVQPNGGVLAFRRSTATAALFAAWHREWSRWGRRDQGAFDRALWEHPVRLWLLSDEFNAVLRYREATEKTAIVHHAMEARRWRGIVDGRLDDPAVRRRWEASWASLHPVREELPGRVK